MHSVFSTKIHWMLCWNIVDMFVLFFSVRVESAKDFGEFLYQENPDYERFR